MCKYLKEQFPELNCPNVSIEEIAINVNQVTQYNLPTIKLKKHTTNKWFKKTYGVDYGVEIGALPPNILKQMIRDSIEKYLDTTEIDKKRKEDSMNIERTKERLRKIIEKNKGGVT